MLSSVAVGGTGSAAARGRGHLGGGTGRSGGGAAAAPRRAAKQKRKAPLQAARQQQERQALVRVGGPTPLLRLMYHACMSCGFLAQERTTDTCPASTPRSALGWQRRRQHHSRPATARSRLCRRRGAGRRRGPGGRRGSGGRWRGGGAERGAEAQAAVGLQEARNSGGGQRGGCAQRAAARRVWAQPVGPSRVWQRGTEAEVFEAHGGWPSAAQPPPCSTRCRSPPVPLQGGVVRLPALQSRSCWPAFPCRAGGQGSRRQRAAGSCGGPRPRARTGAGGS